MTQAELVAQAVEPNTVEAGWELTTDNYLNRVPKVWILKAAREAKGEGTAQLLDHLKKGEVATEAERLLKGSGWLPEVLCCHDLAALEGAEGQGASAPIPTPFRARMSNFPPSSSLTYRVMMAAE